MYQWFEIKLKYEKQQPDGSVKKVVEPYLVDAQSFTEAERRIILEMKSYISGEFEVDDIRRVRIGEMFETTDESADRWFKSKLSFVTLDEKSGKEKRVSFFAYVQAADLPDSIDRLREGMKGTIADYVIESVAETKIVDMFHYVEISKK